jgi:hypothetical protein
MCFVCLCVVCSPNDPTVPLNWPQYNITTDTNLDMSLPFDTTAGLMKPYCDFWDQIVTELQSS